MKNIVIALALMMVLPITANSQNAAPATEKLSTDNADIIPPEIVRVEKVHTDNDEKTLTVGNANRHYMLFCNVKAAGCITPEKDKNYLLFDKNTRWKMPGAKDFMTLAFIQDWTVTYNKGVNIGLISEAGDSPNVLGLYIEKASQGKVTAVQGQAASLDLQKKCADQAHEAFKLWNQANKDPSASFIDHYNEKLNKCFVDIETSGVTVWKFVSDAFEGTEYGTYEWHASATKKYWEVPPGICEVKLLSGEKKECKSSDEFDELIKENYGLDIE